MGDLIAAVMWDFALRVAVVAVIVTALVTFAITRSCTPTEESVAKQKERQSVIETLTPEQRNGLGL